MRRQISKFSAAAKVTQARYGSRRPPENGRTRQNALLVATAPSLYGPAGGVSGRTTFAVLAWLIAWGALKALWRNRHIEGTGVYVTTVALIALGIAACFPPLWGLFG